MSGLRIEIFSDDLDATVDFYRRVLGFTLLRDERGAASEYVSLRLGDVRIGAARRAHRVTPRADGLRREWSSCSRSTISMRHAHESSTPGGRSTRI